MLVFFYILFFIIIFNLIVYFSSIIFEIKNVKIDTTKKPAINDYKINIYLAFLNKVKYFKIGLTKEKIDKMKNLNFSKIKERITKLKMFKALKEKGLIQNKNKILTVIKKVNIKFEKLELKADVGLENIVTLSYIVALLDILISIILAKRTLNSTNSKILIEKYKYTITPIQTKKVYLKSYLNSVFSIKILNIVKISCNLKNLKV